MSQPNYIKQLTEAGITTASDGLLKEFIARGNYSGVLSTGSITDAIAKRDREIEFLMQLEIDLIEEIGETNEC